MDTKTDGSRPYQGLVDWLTRSHIEFEIHEHAPGSKLVMIPQAAHLSNLEQPAAFTKAMQEFLAAH